ncbi:MAG: 50S ribosomal protein L9 [Bacteroidota bacterium]
MEVILKKDMPGLGYKYDTVKVKAGYGRNYLIPQGVAILANNSNRKMIDENIRQAAHKAEKLKNDALAIAEKVQALDIAIGAKAGESGKIFGAVTSLQISDVLSENGFEVDRRRIKFNADIKTIGDYVALIELHKEVTAELNFKVVAE